MQPARALTEALTTATFDPGLFNLEEIDGELRIVDTVLGKAWGYSRPEKIRELIERRMAGLLELGSLPHRGVMIEAGKGAQRKVQEYLLNEAQTHYLLNCCRTQKVVEVWSGPIAAHFTAMRQGKATDPLPLRAEGAQREKEPRSASGNYWNSNN